MTRWENLRVTLAVRRMVFMLWLCGGSPFLRHDAEGNEYLIAKRPRLARLLFRHVDVLGPNDPFPSEFLF